MSWPMCTPTASSAPRPAGIIHLGATSCYVGDNTDVHHHAGGPAAGPQASWSTSSLRWPTLPTSTRTLPTLAFTHFQPAQPTTVGKRATLWMQELLMDLEELEYRD